MRSQTDWSSGFGGRELEAEEAEFRGMALAAIFGPITAYSKSKLHT